MARTSSVCTLLLLATLAQSSLAFAQQAASSAPPKLERIDEGSDTPITVTPQQNHAAKITETRDNGRTTEVQVTTGASSYTMKATPPGSISQPGEGAGGTLRPPQWKVLEFNFGGKKPRELDEPATAEAPPPPPMQNTN